MGTEVEACIRNNWPWAKLPKDVKQVLGNSQREYEKMVVEYSVKNQLRYKGNLVRHVRKNEEQYYDLLMQFSQSHLMLYPYHLSDIVVKELRTTPFNYYINMMMDLMAAERSYDSLPNFTAADCLRLLGIGRNQYIDLMNQARSNKRTFRRAKSTREILPAKPVEIPIEPWWMVCVGSVLEDDVKNCVKGEKDVIDILYDEGPQLSGTLDASVVQKLYHKGLAYLDVPVHDTDNIFVPPLDGFVMNRVLGDYFETLLYKIFVSIDEHTTVKELAEILDIDLQLVKNAVSVFCRLGFAKKRVTGLENLALHVTWAKHMKLDEYVPPTPTPLVDLSISMVSPGGGELTNFADGEDDDSTEETSALTPGGDLTTADLPSAGGGETQARRIAFLFDSTLTAFLMMGNLSTSLKSHAVTLFEVGKLSDEALDNFIEELQRVNAFAEGEAQRYFEHSQALRETILALREQAELDLIRCESLLSLDHQSRLRVLQKTYQLLVSMAPLTPEASPLSYSNPPHFGPAISEVNSPWFRMYLYELVGQGPVSMLITRGTRLRRLPKEFRGCKRLLLCTWSHEPGVVSADTCLIALNETLQSSAVFLQAYSDVVDDSEIAHIPFPFAEEPKNAENSENVDPAIGHLSHHPSLLIVKEKLSLNALCGYVTLLRQKAPKATDENLQNTPEVDVSGSSNSSTTKDPRKVPSNRTAVLGEQTLTDWILFDCVFGIPLFDQQLNRAVCAQMRSHQLFDASKRPEVQFANRHLALAVVEFIERFQPAMDTGADSHRVPYPIRSLLFDGTTMRICD